MVDDLTSSLRGVLLQTSGLRVLNWSGRNNSHASNFIPEMGDPGECRLSFGRVTRCYYFTVRYENELTEILACDKEVCRQLKSFCDRVQINALE
jgi:hypothetical protein